MTMQELELNYEQAKLFEQELSEKANEARIALREKFQEALKQFFVEDDCVIGCADVNISYHDVNRADFRCDIGFKDPENPNRTEFGSSFWFQFEDDKIRINTGSIGAYKLSDIYQLKRNNTVYHLTCVNGEQLEKNFCDIDCSEYIEATHALWKASAKTRDAYKAIESAKVKAVSERITVGKVYKHSLDKNSVSISFYKPCYFSFQTDRIKITKVTNKFVEVEITNTDKQKYPGIRYEKARKSGLIDDILAGKLLEVE